MWFNLLFNKAVFTNVGNIFQSLIDYITFSIETQ